MSEEFNELYAILSKDREDVRKVKDDYEKDVTTLLNRVKNYHVNRLDISEYYDLENDFSKFQINDTFINYDIASDTLNYKIALLQNYLQDLFIEKKFIKFKKSKEEKLGKNEYLEYLHNINYRADLTSKWYQEFINKN